MGGILYHDGSSSKQIKKEQMEKITQDGFAWQILDYIEAENYFKDGKEIFALYDDESEALIEYDTDLNNAIDHGVQIGYAIGFIKTSKV